MIPKNIDKHCLDCIYYQGGFEATLMCHYIFIKDERRPCPPGKDCTVKVKRKRKRRTEKDRRNEK